MTNLEKINKIAEKEIEIQNKTSEIIEKKQDFTCLINTCIWRNYNIIII